MTAATNMVLPVFDQQPISALGWGSALGIGAVTWWMLLYWVI